VFRIPLIGKFAIGRGLLLNPLELPAYLVVVRSQNIIRLENYVIGPISDSLELMAGWVLQSLSAVRMRLSQRLDLLLEFIVLRHQLAVLQRTGTRRPCFRPSERLFWVLLSR